MAGMIQVPYGHMTVSRIEPLMPAEAYKTYGMSMPIKTHWIKATCEEAGCSAYHNGWKTVVPAGSDHAELIRSADFRRRYRYTEAPGEAGLVEFTFPPGQPCFRASEHKLPLERPARFYVADGDFRAKTTTRVHSRAEDWVEDFSEHQDRINTERERG